MERRFETNLGKGAAITIFFSNIIIEVRACIIFPLNLVVILSAFILSSLTVLITYFVIMLTQGRLSPRERTIRLGRRRALMIIGGIIVFFLSFIYSFIAKPITWISNLANILQVVSYITMIISLLYPE